MTMKLLVSLAVSLAFHVAVLRAEEGTFSAPAISEISLRQSDGATIRRVVYSYSDGAAEVVGTKTSVLFTLNRPVKDVWPVFRDFNKWQNAAGLFYSGEFGDQEGKLEFMMRQRDKPSIDTTQAFIVEHIIPQSAIVLYSPLWEATDEHGRKLGSRHEGKNVFMLTEVDGTTIVTAAMEHAYHYHGPEARRRAEEALSQRVKTAQDAKKSGAKDIWESDFIPALRALLDRSK